MLFKSIAVFATFALSIASAFAAPAPEPKAVVKKDAPSGIAQIFAGATTNLTPLTQQLQGLGVADLSVAHIKPITDEITTILNEVIADVKLLVGQEASIVLATLDGTALLAVHDVAAIVSEVVHLVLAALAAVFALLTAHPLAAFADIHHLLFDVGQLVGTLVTTVIQVVGALLVGLDVAIHALLGDLSFIITQLGLTILGGLLGILGL